MHRLASLALIALLVACAPPEEAPPVAQAADVPAVSQPVSAAPDTPTAGDSLDAWIGEYPVRDDGTRLVAVPAVREKLEEAFGVEPGLLDRLSADDGSLAYRMERIEGVGSMIAVAFTPTERSPDARPVYILIDRASYATHAVLTDGGDVFYRASYDATADVISPEAAAWMQETAGVDVVEFARMDDEEVLGP